MNAPNPFTKATKEAATFFSAAHDPLRPDELHGKERIAYFTHDQSACQANSTISLTKLPSGAKVIRGRVMHADMGSSRTVGIGIAGVDSSGEIANGVADSATHFASALDVAAAGQKDFANTIALNSGYVTQKEVYLYATLSAHTWPVERAFEGYVVYVTD